MTAPYDSRGRKCVKSIQSKPHHLPPNLLRGADSALLEANNFDTKLNHLGHLLDELEQLRGKLYRALNEMEGII